MRITTDRLAYWYFRLNGFLGNKNFIVHRRLRNEDHATEIDYLGLRFLHRKELMDNVSGEWMMDDLNSELFKYCPKDKLFICIVEAKLGYPTLNESLIANPESLEKLLLALGLISKDFFPKTIKKMQKYGYCDIHRYFISFIAIGRDSDHNFVQFEKIPVISWTEILNFIYDRFALYRSAKSNLNEWREFPEAQELRNLVFESESKSSFIREIDIISSNER